MNARDIPTGPVVMRYATEREFTMWRRTAEALAVIAVGLLAVAVTL